MKLVDFRARLEGGKLSSSDDADTSSAAAASTNKEEVFVEEEEEEEEEESAFSLPKPVRGRDKSVVKGQSVSDSLFAT